MGITKRLPKPAFIRGILRVIRGAVPETLRMAAWNRAMKNIFHRMQLNETAPLFSAIEIETRTRCNSSCSFCGASVLFDKRKDLLMPEEMFHKIISELKALDYRGAILFFVNNEPLLDSRLATFVKHTKTEIPEARTEVQTNGLKLNAKNGTELLEAGVDILYINNYSDEGKTPPGVEKFLSEVAPLFPKTQVVFTMRRLTEPLYNRAGTAPNGELLSDALPLACTLPFTDLVITASGKVAICCQDLEFKEVMGDFNLSPLREIWEGPAFSKIREELKKGNRNVSEFCKVCDYRGFKEEELSGTDRLVARVLGPFVKH